MDIFHLIQGAPILKQPRSPLGEPRTSEGVIPKLPPSHSWTGCSCPGQREEPQHPNPGGSQGLSRIPAGFLSFLTRTFTTQTKQRGQGGVPTLPTIPFCWFCDKGCQGLASGGLVGWHWGHSAFPPGAPPQHSTRSCGALGSTHARRPPESPKSSTPSSNQSHLGSHSRFPQIRRLQHWFCSDDPQNPFPYSSRVGAPCSQTDPRFPHQTPTSTKGFSLGGFPMEKTQIYGGKLKKDLGDWTGAFSSFPTWRPPLCEGRAEPSPSRNQPRLGRVLCPPVPARAAGGLGSPGRSWEGQSWERLSAFPIPSPAGSDLSPHFSVYLQRLSCIFHGAARSLAEKFLRAPSNLASGASPVPVPPHRF